ncbi:hypothetical protein KC19_8G127000 [Ceratodon purpureus]|uniref:Uncharacterized protein n=1 Tax=Ceratodon purpureus TaxID=3225 RepID=A0A8T0H2R7_CERPU|nr:hypothetical protein KC19_8G127000 [Ceratodon purpureus]
MELDPSWLLLLFVAYALSDPVEFHYQAVDWVCLFFFVGISMLGGEDERRICACCGRSRVRESGGGHAEDNELENQMERRLVYYHDLAVSDPVDRPVFFFNFRCTRDLREKMQEMTGEGISWRWIYNSLMDGGDSKDPTDVHDRVQVSSSGHGKPWPDYTT